MFGRKAIDHKRFNAAVDSSANEVEKALSERKEKMGQEWNDLEKGWQDLGREITQVGITKPSDTDDGMVWLNVGGSEVSVRRSVVKRTNGSSTTCILADLLEGVTWDKRLPRDADGRIVLDESPSCLKRIFHTLLTSSGKDLLRASIAGNNDAPIDEEPYLVHLSRALRLSELSLRMVTRGTTVLEANNVGRLTATIQGWCPGQPNELNLRYPLYRASRDGWTSAAFHARCGDDSPSTITLVRVKCQGNDSSDSIIGGFSSVPWTARKVGKTYSASPGAFVFMLKDGGVSGSTPFHPVKWDVMHGQDRNAVRLNSGGPTFGRGHDLKAVWTQNSATLAVTKSTYFVGPAYRGLNNRPVVEIETFRVYSTGPLPLLDEPACITNPAVADPTPFGSPTASAEEHSIDIHTFGESIAGSLMEERMALREAQMELAEAGAKVTASANALATVYGPGVAVGKEDPVVELSVRGNRVTTLLSTLQACPESFLSTKFNEDRWPATDKDVDEHGRRLIDCSPSVFAKVLDVLRMRKRAAWGGTASQQGCDELVRVVIKEGDRDSFEEFVEKYFPGDLQSFIMDCVEPSPTSGGP